MYTFRKTNSYFHLPTKHPEHVYMSLGGHETSQLSLKSTILRKREVILKQGWNWDLFSLTFALDHRICFVPNYRDTHSVKFWSLQLLTHLCLLVRLISFLIPSNDSVSLIIWSLLLEPASCMRGPDSPWLLILLTRTDKGMISASSKENSDFWLTFLWTERSEVSCNGLNLWIFNF